MLRQAVSRTSCQYPDCRWMRTCPCWMGCWSILTRYNICSVAAGPGRLTLLSSPVLRPSFHSAYDFGSQWVAAKVDSRSAVEVNVACPNVPGKPLVGYDFPQLSLVVEKIASHASWLHVNRTALLRGLEPPPHSAFIYVPAVAAMGDHIRLIQGDLLRALQSGVGLQAPSLLRRAAA